MLTSGHLSYKETENTKISESDLSHNSIHSLKYALTYSFGRIDEIKTRIIHTVTPMFTENHVIVNYAPKSQNFTK